MIYANEWNDTIEKKKKYVVVFGDASTTVIESNEYPNVAEYGIPEDICNIVAIVKCE